MLGLYNHNLIIFLKCCSAQNPFMWIKESSYSFSCDFWLGLTEVSAKNKNTFIIFSLFPSNTCELYYYFSIVLLSADREPGVYASVGLIAHGFCPSLLKNGPENECGLQIVPAHMWMTLAFLFLPSLLRGTKLELSPMSLLHLCVTWILWLTRSGFSGAVQNASTSVTAVVTKLGAPPATYPPTLPFPALKLFLWEKLQGILFLCRVTLSQYCITFFYFFLI